MPVVWNAETEAKLLAGVFKVCDVKVGTKQLAELAAIIGPECTPKAVTHRIAKIKNQAGSPTKTPTKTPSKNGGGVNGAKSPSKDGGKSPVAGKKRGRKSKATIEEGDGDDDDDDEGLVQVKKVKTEDEDGSGSGEADGGDRTILKAEDSE